MRLLQLMALAGALTVAGLATPALAAHGKCGFDIPSLKFAGDPLAQARCLLRYVKMYAHIDSDAADLPDALQSRIGKSTDDVAQAARTFLAAAAYPGGIPGGNDFTKGLSHAGGNDPNKPEARYFVIHDTSSPYLGNVDAFPADIDTSNSVNKLSIHGGSDAKAHVFINREGEWLTGHDFSTAWRATKLENKIVKLPSKGLFVHVELIQPRRRDPNGGTGNDAIAPKPGFTPQQYEALAVAYVAASVRAGEWLIPAFHAALDEGLDDGHDDPQNFDLAAFGDALDALMEEIGE